MHRLLLSCSCVALVACVEPSAPVRETPATTISVAPLAASVSASSSPPASPEPDWDAEMAWARSRFPQLAGLRRDDELEALLAWIPAGKMFPLFFTNVDETKRPDAHPFHCAPAEARRSEDGKWIDLRIPGPEKSEKGETVRSYLGAGIGPQGLYLAGGGGKQKKKKDGTWEDTEGYGTTGQELGYAVGPVEGDAAHLRYLEVRLTASCGPIEDLACGSGGSRPCNRCKDVEIMTSNVRGLGGSHRSRPPHIGPKCSEPCPVVENADLTRIQRLIEHLPTAFILGPGPTQVGLYRTLAACKANGTKPR